MSLLVLTADQRRAIAEHGEATYPEECCGILVGRPLGGVGGDRHLVERLVAADNERADSRHNRYAIDPETILATEKQARAEGLSVVGYYHSHPDHPARPSEFDREHAWPGLSYAIVAVERGRAVDLRSWRLTDERDRFEEEELSDEPAGAERPAVERPAVQEAR